jgi:hypothetical protein
MIKKKLASRICFVLAHIGSQPLDTFYESRALYLDHLCEKALGALRGIAAQVALANFGTNQLARARQTKAFRSGFMCLDFIFTSSLFARHGHYSSRQKYRGVDSLRGSYTLCEIIPGATFDFVRITLRLKLDYAFFAAFFEGARIINMVRPSRLGACSMSAMSASSSATSLRSFKAISG